MLPTLLRVDHVISDPPYSEHVHKSSKSSGRQWMPDVSEAACRTFRTMDLGFNSLEAKLRRLCAAEFARMAKRWIMTFSDVESCHLWRSDMRAFGLDYVRTMAWRRLGGAPQFTGDRPASGFETITLCHPKGRKRWNGGGKAGVYEYPVVQNRGGERGSRLHTTQKPEGLMLDLIADFTDPDEVILDPFCGSGSTLVAAMRLGRRAIGIERDAASAAIAIERCLAEDRQQTVTAVRQGQEALFR